MNDRFYAQMVTVVQAVNEQLLGEHWHVGDAGDGLDTAILTDGLLRIEISLVQSENLPTKLYVSVSKPPRLSMAPLPKYYREMFPKTTVARPWDTAGLITHLCTKFIPAYKKAYHVAQEWFTNRAEAEQIIYNVYGAVREMFPDCMPLTHEDGTLYVAGTLRTLLNEPVGIKVVLDTEIEESSYNGALNVILNGLNLNQLEAIKNIIESQEL